MKKGYSTTLIMGAGLPGVQKLMDEFTVESSSKTGIRIVTVKWQTEKSH
jgi:serine/threonine-protein kinase RsbT